MGGYEQVCLEVSCSNIRPSITSNYYIVDLVADGGQEVAYYDSSGVYSTKLYTCCDITINMYFSNRDKGYLWKVTDIITPCLIPNTLTQITVELYDIDGFNASIDPVEGYYSGRPSSCGIGYVYSVNNNGIPILLDVPNPPSESWAFSQLNRLLMYYIGGGGGGYTGATGANGVTGATGANGLNGVTGATGPAFTQKNIPTISYYLGSDIHVLKSTDSSDNSVLINFNTLDPSNSDGNVSFIYDSSGVLRNLTNDTLTILISGQITTDNNQFDNRVDQPLIYIEKNNYIILSSSVINFQGSSFSSSVIVSPGDTIKIKYKHYFNNIVNIINFNTHITFSQLDYVTGTGGTTGPTGSPGSVTVYSISFDGGSSTNVYTSGPAFDCGKSI
jgi:hypothetical protein